MQDRLRWETDWLMTYGEKPNRKPATRDAEKLPVKRRARRTVAHAASGGAISRSRGGSLVIGAMLTDADADEGGGVRGGREAVVGRDRWRNVDADRCRLRVGLDGLELRPRAASRALLEDDVLHAAHCAG